MPRDRQVTGESENMANKGDYGGGAEVDKRKWEIVCVNSSGNSGGGYKGGVGMANC